MHRRPNHPSRDRAHRKHGRLFNTYEVQDFVGDVEQAMVPFGESNSTELAAVLVDG